MKEWVLHGGITFETFEAVITLERLQNIFCKMVQSLISLIFNFILLLTLIIWEFSVSVSFSGSNRGLFFNNKLQGNDLFCYWNKSKLFRIVFRSFCFFPFGPESFVLLLNLRLWFNLNFYFGFFFLLILFDRLLILLFVLLFVFLFCFYHWCWLFGNVPIDGAHTHGGVSSWLFGFSFIIFGKLIQVIQQLLFHDPKLMRAIRLLLSIYKNPIFQIYIITKSHTMPKISHFTWIGVHLLILFIRGLNHFVEVDNLKFFVVLFVVVLDELVDFPEAFSQSGVEVVLYAIVCSWIINELPAFQALGDYCPLVAVLIV